MSKELKVHWYAPYWYKNSGLKGVVACGKLMIHFDKSVYGYSSLSYFFRFFTKPLEKIAQPFMFQNITCKSCLKQLRKVCE